MLYQYIYKNKKTGEKVYSKIELKDNDLEQINIIKNSAILTPIKSKKKYGK